MNNKRKSPGTSGFRADNEIRKVVLIKVDPKKPNAPDNWRICSRSELAAFAREEDAQLRLSAFGQLDACDIGDIMIIAECGEKMAVDWRKEKDAHNYRQEEEAKAREQGLSQVSIYTHWRNDEGDFLNAEEILADASVNVEEEACRNLMMAQLRAAVETLSEDDRKLIDSIYLQEPALSEREYGEQIGLCRNEVHYKRKRVLQKLRMKLEGRRTI